MSTYHVFKDKSNNLKAIETTNASSIEEVESMLSLEGWDNTNHYGTHASTKEEAIDKAIAANCNFDTNISQLKIEAYLWKTISKEKRKLWE